MVAYVQDAEKKRDSDHRFIWKPKAEDVKSGCVQICEKCQSIKEKSFSEHKFIVKDKSVLECKQCGYQIMLNTDEEQESFILTHQKDTELIDDMIALLRKQTPKQKLYRYRSSEDGALWAADCLQLLYKHDLYRDRIAALEGTVLEKPEKPPVFDMNDPNEREWARGYSPKRGTVFDPNEIDGYRFLQ